ncbi:MAG: FAD-dependent oxidoreductase [Spiroplasma sp.]|nr:FAD-dependent oxidoreductase [Mycoplasmatales bacterium]
MKLEKILIVGGVAGGASTAARARRMSETAEIVMFEKGPFVSFSNCGLPYHISGEIKTEEELILMTPEKFIAQYRIDARVNNEVVKVNSSNKTVTIKNVVTGENYEEGYDKLVISPGAYAFVPPFEGLDKIDSFTLKTVPDVVGIMNFLKSSNAKHITVVGGGFIGLEAAENLKIHGVEVTLIEGADQIIPFVDKEMSYFGQKELIAKGIKVLVNEMVEKFDTNKVILKSGKEITTDGVILAIGVKPDTAFLKDSGIKMNDAGYMLVNDNYQTNIEDIYACGDAILVKNALSGQMVPLSMAGPANKQGKLIADHMFGMKIMNKGYIGSGIVKLFDINIACTGLNEKQLKDTNISYDVTYVAPPGIVGIMPGGHLVFTKLIWEKGTGKILGMQCASSGASDKRVDIIATAIKGNMTIWDLPDLEFCYAPTFGTGKDVVNKVGYVACNVEEKAFKQVPFTKVYGLLNDNAQIFDIREIDEYAAGRIDGIPNVPMSVIRDRLSELDKSQPVYVHCRTGERSYKISVALDLLGYNAVNIAGSYEFTKVFEEMECYNDATRKNIMK